MAGSASRMTLYRAPMRSALIAGVTSLFLAAPALAQDSEADPDFNPGQIVVTGKGLPASPAVPAYDTIVLERDQIVSSGSGRLEDVLSSVAGFQQFRRSDSRSSNPTAQGVTLRALGGNATSRALVLLDGVPLADPFFGYIPFSAITPERLETIRVTRGGGSGPFGAGALAGTIELDSADAETLGLFSGQALINQRGETLLSAMAAPEIGEGFAVVSGRWDRGQGFYTTPEEQRVPATARAAFDSWSASARLVQPVGDEIELQLRGLAFEDHRTLRFEGADSSSEGQDLSLRVVSRGPWQVDALGYVQWRNFTNVVISSRSFAKVLDQKDTPSEGLGGKLEVRPPVGEDHVLRFGADYRRSEGDLEEVNVFSGPRFAGGVTTDLGFFVEDDWRIDDLIVTGGVRGDRWTIRDGYRGDASGAEQFPVRDGWEFSWRTGAIYDVSEALRLRAAAYTGLRLPTLNELYRPFVVVSTVTRANEALRPEKLEGYEVGLDWRAAPGVVVALTVFDNEVEDAIANVTLEEDLRQRRNVDAIEARGAELGLAVERGEVSFDGTLAYTDAQVRGSGPAALLSGNRPAQTPRWAASGTLAWEPREHMLFGATLRHIGDQFEGDLEDDVLPAATTLDLFAQVPVRGALSFVVRTENLLNEEIVTRNDAGDLDLGIPRTVWAGLRYGF